MKNRHTHPVATASLLLALGISAALGAAAADSSTAWWAPGQGTPLADFSTYDSDRGQLGVLNASGQLDTKGHPFFEAIGTNGRACVTCHQPADGMSLSVRSIRERWAATAGKDALFAAVDGMNCPNLPPDDPRSHSLLIERGLFRIALPWPPQRPDGTRIDPEFTIEVVRDPSGCNTDPRYGLQSASPSISVFRRPRAVANTKYTTHQNFGIGPFIGKNGMPTATDPLTGKPTSMNLMSDARAATLAVQAEDAAEKHLQITGTLSAAQIARITGFEAQVYVAQVASPGAGSLVEPDGPPAFGPRNLAAADAGVLGNNTTRYVFPMGGKWVQLPRAGDEAENARHAARESIARGHDVFMFRTFWIRDSMHLNSVGLGNPAKRTCATCHGMHMTGMDTANGWMDIGTTNLPWASEVPLNPWTDARPQMPLFRITCKPTVKEHPFLGRVIYTQDPGRALISGQCNDVGTIVMQQFRGLAARAPYFSNGSATTLRELVAFYDRRYNIGYSELEKQDLVNFLGAL
ncbi:MAG: hypothetical protein ABI868_00935 [Acidobacteriota bacterium]